MSSMLFINGSGNRNGTTAALASTLLDGQAYRTVNLIDLHIDPYGAVTPGDQFNEILAAIRDAGTVVIGSPVYWHSICASVRNLMERFYGVCEQGEFSGRRIYFIFQGAAPSRDMLDSGEYSMSRFAQMYGFDYRGMISDQHQARLGAKSIQ